MMDERTEYLIQSTALTYAIEGKPKQQAYRACMKVTGLSKIEPGNDWKIMVDRLEITVDKIYTQVKASRIHA